MVREEVHRFARQTIDSLDRIDSRPNAYSGTTTTAIGSTTSTSVPTPRPQPRARARPSRPRTEGHLSAEEVAIEAGVTRATVLNAIKAGKLPATKIPSGGRWGYAWEISEDSFKDWMASR